MTPGERRAAAESRQRVEVGKLLDQFAEMADGPVPFVHHQPGLNDFRTVLAVCVHGDEVGPLRDAVHLLWDLRFGPMQTASPLTIVVGNPEAARHGKRFLDSDLNRVFVSEPPDDREGRRARELMPILDDCDLFVDLHQTGAPTASAFYTLPWRRRDDHWARALRGAPVWVTRRAGETFSPGTCCADEYVRAQGKPGITVELSQKGPLSSGGGIAGGVVIRRLVSLLDKQAGIADLAAEAPPLRYLQTVHREPFLDPRQQLRDDLGNLSPVTAGELLSPPGAPELRAPADGFVMFPKFPRRYHDGRATRPISGELFHLAAELDGHPSEVWGEA